MANQPHTHHSTAPFLHVLTDIRSINFNIVSKGLGSDRMSYYLNEAAGEMRDLLIPTIAPPKAKL